MVNDPAVSHNYRRVFLRPFNSFRSYHEAYDTTQIIHAENISLIPEELDSGVKRGGRWVAYSTWEMHEPPEGGWEGGGRGKGKDLVLVHGESFGYGAYLTGRTWRLWTAIRATHEILSKSWI